MLGWIHVIHLSTEKEETKEGTRIPQANEDCHWSPGAPFPTSERTEALNGLTMALSRKYRLSRTNDIRAVLKGGRRSVYPPFRIFSLANNLSYSRFAFVTPKTVSKKAVTRNTLRRRGAEWIRANRIHLSYRKDFVIFFSKEAGVIPRHSLYEYLEGAFNRNNPHLPKNTIARSQ